MKALSIIFISLTVVFSSSAFAADIAKGKEKFTQLCASCHGAEGKGDGPIAAGLPENMKPRNLEKGDFKIATDDAKMKEVIRKGGAAFGLSPMMAPQPESNLTDADLDNVVAFIRTLKQ